MAAQLIRVLLVEDNPGDAGLIKWMLKETGEVRFELIGADRLSDGLSRLATEDFSVVLLDLSLPDSQGLDTFRKVHAAFPRVPVVVLTGLVDENVGVLRAVQEGAQDYLVKGQVLDRHLVHALRYAVGRHQRQLLKEQESGIAPYDVELLRTIQRCLLPNKAPRCQGLDVHGVSLPAGAAGGDYFDYLECDNQQLGIVIGDVTGHGPGPALLMASTRAYLRAFMQGHTDIAQALRRTNRALAGDVADGRFVTLLLAVIDGQQRLLRYASAGHCPGFILDPSGAIRAQLYSTGLPLGISPVGDFPAGPEIRLQPGELVVLLTDGIPDASHNGRPFGYDRALDVVRQHRHRPTREIVDNLIEAVRDFEMGSQQQDDITAIVLKV